MARIDGSGFGHALMFLKWVCGNFGLPPIHLIIQHAFIYVFWEANQNIGLKLRWYVPHLEVIQPLHEDIKVYGIWRVEIVFISKCYLRLFGGKRPVERVLRVFPSAQKTMVLAYILCGGQLYHWKNDHPWQVERAHNLHGQTGLPRATRPCYPNNLERYPRH